MTRSEERIESVPLMKMMVHPRQVPDKKSSVNETLNDGLVTFAVDREESDVCKPRQVLEDLLRREYKYSEPDSLLFPRHVGEEAMRCADFEHALREAANGDGDSEDQSSSRNGRRRRPAPLDRKQLHRICLGPTLTTSLSFKETRNTAREPEKLTADDSTGKFAYISLDGRLINAELASSARSIEGTLGDAEARAWEDFVSMQRVLIVAVSAAAAAAAKHRNRGRIDRLLKTVEKRILRSRQHRILSAIASLCNVIFSSLHTFFWTLVTTMGVTSMWSLQSWSGMLTARLKLLPSMWSQENDLFSLRQELSELCTQSNTNANDREPIQIPESLAVRGSPKTPRYPKPSVLRGRFEGDNIKVNRNLQDAWSSAKPREVPELRDEGEFDGSQLSRDSPANKDVVFVESSPCTRSDLFNSSAFQVGDETRTEEAKWYVNPMVETSEDFYFTPERCNSMLSVCSPAVQDSDSEWDVLRSSFGSRQTYPSTELSPLVDPALATPTQTTVSDSTYPTVSQTVLDDGAVHQEHVAMRAWCAATILDLRKRMLSVLDKEASMVMVALDTSVRDAKFQLASMHLAVASCWKASMPKVLAALRFSPTEFDSWLLNEAQGASTWNETSKIEESIVAWRQYLEKNDVPSEDAERKSPNKFNLSESTVSLSGADEWLAPSAYSPHYRGHREIRIGVLGEGLACSRISSEDSVDQLLGESDKGTVEVAVMEGQIINLGQDIVGRDDKQICKRSGNAKQDWENQVKGCEDVAALVKELQSKEVEVADLKNGQQALLDAKCKEVEELKEDFKRRDAGLDKRLAPVKTTKAESAHTLAMLEEICRKKYSALSDMKQDIQALELKVQKSVVHQSPIMQRGLRYSTSSILSPRSGNGTFQKQRFSDRHAPSVPGSDLSLEHIGRFKTDVPSNKDHFRNLPYANTQGHEELTDDGRSERGYDLETSHDYSSPPGSTIGDDCSVSSLVFSEAKGETHFGSENCSSGDDSTYRSSKDRLSGAKGSSYYRTLQKQKSASSDLRRAVTPTASSSRSLTRTQSNKKNFTSATSESKTAAGEKFSTKPLQRTYLSDVKKVIKDPNSPQTSNLKGLRSVVANHDRSSSLDMTFKSNICATLETSGLSVGMSDSRSPSSQERSVMKRKRWV